MLYFSVDGMSAYLTVLDCHNYTQAEQLSGNVRSYYLAAEMEEWNYATSGLDMFSGQRLDQPGR